jgi:predicted GNAT family acetyltransferase
VAVEPAAVEGAAAELVEGVVQEATVAGLAVHPFGSPSCAIKMAFSQQKLSLQSDTHLSPLSFGRG